jgi:hypothetical protein
MTFRTPGTVFVLLHVLLAVGCAKRPAMTQAAAPPPTGAAVTAAPPAAASAVAPATAEPATPHRWP